MQFRFRDEDIEVCRLTIDPETGRRQRMNLGTIDIATLQVSPSLKANCRPDELAEIVQWQKRQVRTKALAAEQVARTLPEQIQSALDWLSKSEDDALRQALADDIRANWQALRKTLRERGFI